MVKRQSDFFDSHADLKPGRLTHGGLAAAKRRKLSRPLDPRRPAHFVLKSSKAKGRHSLYSKQVQIERIVKKYAGTYRIKIHNFANVGTHLHLVVSFKARRAVQRFVQIIASLISRVVTGARKGQPFGRFWDALAFSRVVTGRRDFLYVQNYVDANQLESADGYAERTDYLLELALERRRAKKLRPICSGG